MRCYTNVELALCSFLFKIRFLCCLLTHLLGPISCVFVLTHMSPTSLMCALFLRRIERGADSSCSVIAWRGRCLL